jgi:hypothetical protein
VDQGWKSNRRKIFTYYEMQQIDFKVNLEDYNKAYGQQQAKHYKTVNFSLNHLAIKSSYD